MLVFGGRVRALRAARGWSQMELGHRAGRHFSFVSSIERGERNVTLLTLLQLAEALGVDPAVLVTADEHAFEHARTALPSIPISTD
jgi:transcriptional regulator with XRE-family HTH domain